MNYVRMAVGYIRRALPRAAQKPAAPPIKSVSIWAGDILRGHRGSYRILGLLGVGGMGKAFSAENLATGLPVAVKIPDLTDKSDADKYRQDPAQHFRDEAGFQRSNPDHPGFPLFIDTGDFGGLDFIVMEKVNGESLFNILCQPKPMHLGELIKIMRTLVENLAFLHQYGRMHLDIKPENLVLTGDARVVVVLDQGMGGAYKARKYIGGTIGYISPEQLRKSPDLDGKSDIYSAGIVFKKMLGRLPIYEAGRISADCLDHLKRIIQMMTEDNPKNRATGPRLLLEINNFIRAYHDFLSGDDLSSPRVIFDSIS